MSAKVLNLDPCLLPRFKPFCVVQHGACDQPTYVCHSTAGPQGEQRTLVTLSPEIPWELRYATARHLVEYLTDRWDGE